MQKKVKNFKKSLRKPFTVIDADDKLLRHLIELAKEKEEYWKHIGRGLSPSRDYYGLFK